MTQDTDIARTPVTQFSIMLQNQAGAFSSLLTLLKNSGVELLGLSVKDSSDVTVIRIVVSDPETAQHLFLEKGIPHTTRELLVVAFREPAAELLKCVEVFNEAETNIDFGYALLPHPQGKTLLAFHVDDPEFGKHILTQAGFTVISQDDLSR